MTNESKIDYGSIQIHKKAIADIARESIAEIDGVSLIPETFSSQIQQMFGQICYPGITVLIDKEEQISIDLRIQVRYGINIPDMARQVQDVIKTSVERIADISLKDIHVHVQGIERGNT